MEQALAEVKNGRIFAPALRNNKGLRGISCQTSTFGGYGAKSSLKS